MYSLKNIPGFSDIISASPNARKQIASALNIKCFQWNYKNRKNYTILKYDKKMLPTAGYDKLGLLRSVIIEESGKVCCFAPPKSLSESAFNEQFRPNGMKDNGSEQEDIQYTVEEFVDGTMINAFYDEDLQCWQIATRSSVGAEISFYMEKGFKQEDTFSYMFYDICNEIKFDINSLDKTLVYSFVMQHPCNRIVKPIKRKALYLVEIYRIHNEDLHNQYITTEVCPEIAAVILNLSTPTLYDSNIKCNDTKRIDKIRSAYASKNTRYDIVGVFIKNNLGQRFKYRNPNYNYVKKLRGNNPKLQFQYLHLRKDHLVTQYLMYYPEHTELFDGFQQILHEYTRGLYENYVSCFILKKGNLGDYPEKYQSMMKDVHREIYISRLMHTRERMNLSHVIDYVNTVPPAKMMFLTNFDMRRNTIQDHVFSHKALVDSTAAFPNSIDTKVIDDELKPVSMVS